VVSRPFRCDKKLFERVTKKFNKSPVYKTPTIHRHAYFLPHPPKELKFTTLFYLCVKPRERSPFLFLSK
jgi:hypothetical protein